MAQAEADRAALLARLRREGILHASDDEPIVRPTGESARWMLNSLGVSLTAEGAALAGRALLRLLERFEGRQLATYGTTGIPLLQACVLQSKGRYRGLLVRKERKPHGARRLIEGTPDLDEPVIIIDDSISSGHSVEQCASALREAGFDVEGAAVLVRFGYEGVAGVRANGLRVEALYDIYDDFMSQMPDEDYGPLNPTKVFPPLVPSPRRAREGVHPATLARQAMAEFLKTGRLLKAPRTLSSRLDAAGGTFVSVRRQDQVHDRPARGGFWHFPGEPRGSTPDDIVLAAVQTAWLLQRDFPQAAAVLDACWVAVTTFSALQRCGIGQLDNDRYGIVVRSLARRRFMGGALPRMPGITNEWQQFVHAHTRNAQLYDGEPYELLRHEVFKAIEPGARWQPSGVADSGARVWAQRRERVQGLAEGVRQKVLEALGLAPVSALPTLVAEGVEQLFVTLYVGGEVRGCRGAALEGGQVDASLDQLVAAVLDDERFSQARPSHPDEVAVGLSLLWDRFEVGEADVEFVARAVRIGQQALEVRQGEAQALLLPQVMVTHDLTRVGFVEAVIAKAGLTQGPFQWARFDCQSWLVDAGGVRPLVNALPSGPPSRRPELKRLLVGYLRRHHVSSGELFGLYAPFADEREAGLHPARVAHGAWVKLRVGLTAEGLQDLERVTAEAGLAERSFALLAHLQRGKRGVKAARSLADGLWPAIGRHGQLGLGDGPGDQVHSDYVPGQVLLALGEAVRRRVTSCDVAKARQALRWCRRRFRLNQSWGAVSWVTRASAAWAQLLDDRPLKDFAFEVADWALQAQSLETGAFLTPQQDDPPGFTTAVSLEGVASCLPLATGARRTRYRKACEAGLTFLDQLVYQPRDTSVLPNPEWALGGVRASLTSSEVRLDFVQHVLGVMLALEQP